MSSLRCGIVTRALFRLSVATWFLGISACNPGMTTSRDTEPVLAEAAHAYTRAPAETIEEHASRLVEVLNRSASDRRITRAELVRLLGPPFHEEAGMLHYRVLERESSRMELVIIFRGNTLRRATLGVADIHRGKPTDSNAAPPAEP